jgi:myo-inositol-1(or 4)-monophosphatase
VETGRLPSHPVDAGDALALLDDAAAAVRRALDAHDDWGPSGTRVGQYRSDLAADAAALAVLRGAGVAVLSEESGWTPGHGRDADVTVVLDPLDGSTNAAHGIPWFATSLCAVDADGPLAAVVVHLTSGVTYRAGRGSGATCNGAPVSPSTVTELADAVVGLSGLPPRHLGWRQYRALGASALDLCLVGAGGLDGYLDCSPPAHGPWDYLGGLLVCREAGASVADGLGGELVALRHDARRTPVAAATPELLGALLAARASW